MGYSPTSLVVPLLSLHIRVIVLCLCAGIVTSKIPRNETDRLALLQLKTKITQDPSGVLSSWNDTVHFCQWHGVTCGRRHQRVIVLDLRSLELEGSIAPHIGNLSFLRELHLHNNSFRHQIPAEVGRLHRLQVLNLYYNLIGGKIPSNISSCFNLILLNIIGNQLVGEIPVELGSMLKLQQIILSDNNLTGSIPSSFGNMSSLEKLYAGDNNLDGRIPDALGQLKNLTLFAVGGNRLSGTIPLSFFNISSITRVDVGDNQIHGSLPSDMGITLPNLQFFSIHMNQFTGSFPVSISNASNLENFNTLKNKLTGRVPNLRKLNRLEWFVISSNRLGDGVLDDLSFLCSLTNATSLELLGIDRNNFGGELPECICNLSTSLAVLLIDNNQIFGGIPSGIGNLINLEILSMWGNRLSGNIRSSIGKLQKLKELFFAENKLSGEIPPSLGNLSRLMDLSLSENNLHGSIPSNLGNCKNLRRLTLHNNHLSGTIPPEVVSLSSLSMVLSLSNNHLSGAIPVEVGYLINLGVLDVSKNMLTGVIPSSLGSCIKLEFLNMEGNFFQGAIPSSLSSLRGIEILDLSRNNFSGEIPKFLESFRSLQFLNLSFNDFKGMVPIEGVFKNASVISILGNSKLCGGIPEFQLSACKFNLPEKGGLTLTLKIIISLLSGLLGVTLMVSILYIFWLRGKSKESTSSTSCNSLLEVSYQSLLKATDGFSVANLIGVGSFGSVYKGILEPDRPPIAIKVLNLLRQGATKSFIAECEALRNIRHRNILKVLTACSGVDYHGNEFKSLVYEFMVNGSLDEWLHPVLRADEAHKEPRNLNLLQRLNISIDVACALDYLHQHSHTSIVHCDLKPSNVLLDDEMVGHVGDFGLARFLQDTTASQTSSVGLRGSVGYAAPEYGMGSVVSTYGDVYSYGILVLELFTGKRPTNNMFKDGFNLHNFTKEAFPERVVEIMDPILLREIDEVETNTNNTLNQSNIRKNIIIECLVSIFGIGVACSAELPRNRMNINDVVVEMHLMRNKLLEAGTLGRRNTRAVQSVGV